MILTEEQRAAIHAVSGLLTAIGCPQCHSYLQKNYTHHIEVLRAMTDSSEHFSDATKMIGFDMEKARASIAHYRIENPSNVDTESALKELVDQANLAEDALAEIERLQGFETAARDLNNDLIRIAGERDELAARIQELEGMLDARSKEIVGRIQECQACQIDQLRAEGKIGISEAPGRQEEAELSTSREVKRLEARNEALLKIGRKPLEDCHRIQQTLRDRLDRIHGYLFDHNAPWKNGDGTDDIAIAYMNRQAARIQELEDALAEERAKRNVAGHGDCFYRTPSRTDPLVWKCDKGVICDWNCCPIKNEKRTDALQELQAEGKIGPDAKPRSWQITEERIGLLEYCLETLLDAPDIEEIPGPGHSIEMLRAMLREAEQ